MKIHDDHQHHGSALIQIAEHERFTAINKLKTKTGSARSTFRINDNIGIYLKYAGEPTERYSEYHFTFNETHIAEVQEIAAVTKAFVALVCVEDRHICCLTAEQLLKLIAYRRAAKGTEEPHYTIIAQLPEGKQFRAYVNKPGKKGTITGKAFMVPRNSFPSMIFE